MGENQSFDSSKSTLTQCTNSAAKRKRDSESDCDSFAVSERTRRFKSSLQLRFSSVRPLPMTIKGLFEQLALARLSMSPYDDFTDWSDVRLWHRIESILKQQNGYVSSSPSLEEILGNVLKYYNHYLEDRLVQVKDESLRKDMLVTFDPFQNARGCLSGKHIQSVKTTINKILISHGSRLPSSSSEGPVVGYEDDFAGRNIIIDRVKCMNDLKLLDLSSDETMAFFTAYGPSSNEYKYASKAKTDTEKNVALRELVDNAKAKANAVQSSSLPASLSSSSKRNRAN